MTGVPSQLTWDVYVTAEEPIVTDDLPLAPPSGDGRRFPRRSSPPSGTQSWSAC